MSSSQSIYGVGSFASPAVDLSSVSLFRRWKHSRRCGETYRQVTTHASWQRGLAFWILGNTEMEGANTGIDLYESIAVHACITGQPAVIRPERG
jgi:hypothetical protein